MNITGDMEKVARDTQVIGLFTALATAATSEPGFNRASYIAKVEGTLAKMESVYDKHLLEMVRIVLMAIKAP
ncbi:hypothetical protein [Pseudomonas asplenii]|uniref:hypothetical protein n=1 Tax=Pseudomonas asplenii TaxID=53407 RepID=UPI0006B648C4|nr:hypothetical protein [Pseudomonas fuscovaginae]